MKFEYQHLDPKQLPDNLLAKWPSELLLEGFVPFPKMLLRSLRALFGESNEIDELVTVLSIADFKRRNLTRAPSSKYLAFIAGIPLEKLEAAIQRLRDKGWIELRDDDSTLDALDIDMRGLAQAVLSHTKESEK